jgi:integrase/recombinase XerC
MNNNNALTTSAFSSYLAEESDFDLLAALLADKRSPQTKRAYQKDLQHFFLTIAGSAPKKELVAAFLLLPRASAIALVMKYKAGLMAEGLKEATINRRLASIKSLVRLAQKLGKCTWSLEEISGEKIKTYRDTTGIDKEYMQKVLATPNTSTLKGKRDACILHLLMLNALRRNEVVQCDVGDFDAEAKTLAITGKGKGTQKTLVSISNATTNLITDWLVARGTYSTSNALFVALDNCNCGRRLTGQAVYDLVRKASADAGISKIMSPHRCRHSAITEALNATGGDVRRVQKFSRHSKLETLMLYDDNRLNHQGEITEILENLMNTDTTPKTGE